MVDALARCLTLVLLAGAGGVDARAQGAVWFIRGGEAGVRICGASVHALKGLAPAPVTTAAGQWTVHFGADELGKPGSLPLLVPEGAVVQISVAVAPPIAAETIAVDDPRCEKTQGDEPAWWRATCVKMPPEQSDRRVVVGAVLAGAKGQFGAIVRWIDRHRHYRFLWDLDKAELRLERMMGSSVLVLARAPAPPVDDKPHQLALQARGFRLQGFVDDVLVVQELDGAFARGDIGVWEAGRGVQWPSFAHSDPVEAIASSALVGTPGSAICTAATAVAAGHLSVVQLVLDRPHALVPVTADGTELWLLQRPVVPQVLLGDWRGSTGPGAIGEVPPNGLVTAEVRWPDLPAVRLQAVLVTMLLVTPGGEEIVGRTPFVPLRM